MAKKLARKSSSKALRTSAAKKKSASRPLARGSRSRKFVYFFGSGKADGNRNMKDLLGGKGAGLAEMTNAGLPVPPGFTISTEACTLYYKEGRRVPASVDREMLQNLGKLEKAAGAKLGDVKNPLLVSVRSGAKFSMPGMMDTILNLGLNDRTVEGLKARTNNGRFAFDSYRRFIQMYGTVVLEIPKDAFEEQFERVKEARKVHLDTELDESALRDVVARFKEVVQEQHLILQLDEERAMAALPRLLPESALERKRALEGIRQIMTAAGGLSGEAARRMKRVEELFEAHPAQQ